MDDQPIGFFSWDPRELPQEGIIGQNCILPSQRQKGLGKLQMEEVLSIFRKSGAETVTVITDRGGKQENPRGHSSVFG